MSDEKSEEARSAEKPKRVMSAEQRAKIAAAMKKYQRSKRAGATRAEATPTSPKKVKAKAKPKPLVAATVPVSSLEAIQAATAKYASTVKQAKADLRAAILEHTR